ncbi:hypothetical protein ANN_18524 [Periplaneta americana]|uniref:Uncharacterized protein n=1 Tax=Periplaneta americana TaxID=6978 RepID=A0ABQ8SQ08_PERAM|nr:hypothetical protein ANN_18524 [Periplaneta americana]
MMVKLTAWKIDFQGTRVLWHRVNSSDSDRDHVPSHKPGVAEFRRDQRVSTVSYKIDIKVTDHSGWCDTLARCLNLTDAYRSVVSILKPWFSEPTHATCEVPGPLRTNPDYTRDRSQKKNSNGKESFNRKRSIFYGHLEKELRKRLVKSFVWSVALSGAETWTLRRSEEKRLRTFEMLRVFENKVLRKIFGAKRDEVTGEWRKLHNTELHALYSSPDIIRNIKSRRLRWAGHVARMGESRNAYRVLVGRPEGKRPLGRSRRRWEDNIKMDLREVEYDDREWINLAQDRDRWRAYVRAAMNLRVP